MLDDLVAALDGLPLKLNNLFQRDDGTWQANLRERDPAPDAREIYHEFGIGDSAVNALLRALESAGYGVTEEV